MLQIKNISKTYTTGELVQKALGGVTLNFRDNEFVAILGPSGSGKTTLLNIIGGLDRYDDGDLVINNISTKRYKDRDWDSYRNHTIGFVFQSYNLISHQSILSNVELALTISGVSRAQRRERAKTALERVGLGDQLHKKPNQMSGGQMQRVAIARALVNDPEILLADEPTGALDTETSLQVMELLKEVASDRLVIMVTHNPKLAEEYSNRIVELKDGAIESDTNPYVPKGLDGIKSEHRNMGRSSMSLLTSFSLSFNNLRTKKARTFLTSFAGSIGIIGIALILALSTGVNDYITARQRETMASYPISIQEQSIDLSSLIATSGMTGGQEKQVEHSLDAVYSDATALEKASKVSSSISKNNLTAFKEYLDDPDCEINKYLSANGVVYSYNVNFDVYTSNGDGELICTSGAALAGDKTDYSAMMGGAAMSGSSVSTMMNNVIADYNPFGEMIPGKDGAFVSTALTDNFELLCGSWPETENDLVLFLDRGNEIDVTTLCMLGLIPENEYNDMMAAVDEGKSLDEISYSWSYDDLIGKTFYLVPAYLCYEKNDDGSFSYIGEERINDIAGSGIKLKISGIVRTTDEEQNSSVFSSVLGYTSALTKKIIDSAAVSEIVKAQMANNKIDVVSGLSFDPELDETKISDTVKYLSALGTTGKAQIWKSIAQTLFASDSEKMAMLDSADEAGLAAMLDAFLQNPDDSILLAVYDRTISVGSYDENLKKFGYVSYSAPTSISIYADTFEDKESISDCIGRYNDGVTDENRIVYTDITSLLFSAIVTIINVISYVLIAFVGVSLVVSSIMIGIITYISVLERTKEIGILRAIGASKKNISQVFTAETFLIGLLSGAIGVGISYLLLIPGNMLIHSLAGTADVSATLPAGASAVLVIISVILTLIGGLIPSRKAAKKDPVIALRTE